MTNFGFKKSVYLSGGIIGTNIPSYNIINNSDITLNQDSYSIDFWIKSVNNAIIMKCVHGSKHFVLYGNSLSDWYNSKSYPIESNDWFHIMIIRNSGIYSVYINGICLIEYESKEFGSPEYIFWGGNDPWYGEYFSPVYLQQITYRDYAFTTTNFDPIITLRDYNRLYNHNDYIYGIEKSDGNE